MLTTTLCLCVEGFQTTQVTNIVARTRDQAGSKTSTRLNLFGINTKKDEPKEIEPEDEEPKSFLQVHGSTMLKVVLPSFISGGIATLGVLFLPLISDYYAAFDPSEPNFYNKDNPSKVSTDQNNLNNVNQPVILFETILNDLNNAYVDDVDIQKLFETGVKAMTASLDPYTEFESRTEAMELEESVSGKYGGVGLVIRGGMNLGDDEDDTPIVNNIEKIETGGSQTSSPVSPPAQGSSPPVAVNGGGSDKSITPKISSDDESDEVDIDDIERKRARQKSMEDGIRVVSAFEGYAYDAGMRVGDKLLAIDDWAITPTTSVDEVRNHLRGDPGTEVSIKFVRDGVGDGREPQTITIKRSIVSIPDVKYFGFYGDPKDRIGYIDLSGFANDAGREVRFAIRALQHGAEMIAREEENGPQGEGGELFNLADADPTKLKGLILDLRSNPGGLLTSAVDVSTLFVPNGSDIVSAKGRGFPESLYRSKTEPTLSSQTNFAVLVNDQTASAAEIVSGAVQDLDVGVVVGKGRTFGKGLVQNVQDLPYQTALKYTVAKYYTPSGRCIQSTEYKEGGRGDDAASSLSDGTRSYKSRKVADKDRSIFYTAHGRVVKDGGGVEVDYKAEPQKASPLEVILLNTGAYADFAAEWSKTHELTDNFKVDETTYQDFQRFIQKRQDSGDMKLEVLYDLPLRDLQKKLKASKFDSSSRELDKLRADIIKDVKQDFTKYKKEIIEDLEQTILSRYLPDSMVIARGLKNDVQVAETAKLLKNDKEYNRLLARDKNGVAIEKSEVDTTSSASTSTPSQGLQTLQTQW